MKGNWAYTRIKNSTIASGASPIGSVGRASDEDGNIGFNTGVKIDFIIGGKHQIINSTFHSNREGFMTSSREKQLDDFVYSNSQTRLSIKI
jgi:hypothetical protein